MKIGKIKKVPVRELWRREDKDFTIWLEENIDYLNEVLDIDVVIEKREESVGPFRVDLYGEDNLGNKVIIENQLEKSDHDHLGKVLTYLVNLEANTGIWITTESREEHIAVVEWLNQNTSEEMRFYLIDLEAIVIEDQPLAAPLFTVVKGPTTQGKQLGAEKKEDAMAHAMRMDFWREVLMELNKVTSLFKTISPTKDYWITAGRSGFTPVSYECMATRKYVRIELSISGGTQEENKLIFDNLFEMKDEIEKAFGEPMVWQKLNEKKKSEVKFEMNNMNWLDATDRPRMIEFLVKNVPRFERAFKQPLAEVRKKMEK